VHRLTGIGVSPGVVVGRAVLLMQNPLVIRFPIGPEQVPEELARLEEARERSRRQLVEIKARVARGAASELGYLFEAQLLMIDDPMLVARARELIAGQQVNAEWAVQSAFEDLSGIFEGIEDAYLRERRGDVADVVGRLRLNLGRARGHGPDLFRDVDAGSVLIADELTPSMAAQVDWRKIQGFVSDTGSRTHHTAILARSLHVPAVVGLGLATSRIQPGVTVIIDGTTGEVVVDPPPDVEEEARRSGSARSGPAHASGRALAASPATTDGVAIALQANIELPDDIAIARGAGADGIGLYRSEFLLAMTPADALTEDVQFAAYRALLEGMAPGAVTIRTFDVDDDQLQPWPRTEAHQQAQARARVEASRGPLGLRAIRLSLARRDVFKVQLRALLRSARHGSLRIIFPFVSGVEEFREAKAVLGEAAADLAARGETVDPMPPVGVMIEIPSAAITADLLAREADFFSIGTNDLIQYSLAVDRTDARVSRLFEPLHPAVLRTLRGIIRAAARRRLPVSLCGEMAADPAILPLLIGLGLRDFSMSPAAIPVARAVVQRLDATEARRLSDRVMRMATVADIERCLARRLEHGPARSGPTGAKPSTGGTSGER
jgi:phosphoenolpyruvate-protein phosphotransferase (PTS system enzyme I)